MGNLNYQTSRLERLSYGGFFLGQNIIYAIQFQFLTYFYVEYVGLSLGSTTTMLLIARLWDAFNDPIMGAIVDRTNFKSGKYIPWLRVITYILPLSLFFVFININASYSVKLIYAYVTYIAWGMIYTVSDSPIFSLCTVMTTNTYERDVLISYGRFAAAVAAISTAVFMSLKVVVGWSVTVFIYCAFSFLVMLPLQFIAKERVKYVRSQHITFKSIFTYLFKNKYLMIYYLGFFAIDATNVLQPMAVYFANSNLGSESMVTVIMGTSILPVVLISPFLPKLISKFGKRRLTVVSSILTIIMCVLQYFVGYDSIAVFLIMTAIRVVFTQIPLLIYGMFTADCIEYGAYVNGERTEGVSFSVQTLVTKLAGAICGTICLNMLSFFGYVQQATSQSQATLDGIWFIMTLVPVAGYAVMLIVMKFYDLSEDDVSKMIAANNKGVVSDDK